MASTRQAHPVGLVRRWFGLFGGLAAWGAQLGLGYFLATLACLPAMGFQLLGIGGYQFLIIVVTLITAAIALAATVVAAYSWRQTESVGWRGFMAFVGMLLSGLFFAVILFQGMPLFFFDPVACQG